MKYVLFFIFLIFVSCSNSINKSESFYSDILKDYVEKNTGYINVSFPMIIPISKLSSSKKSDKSLSEMIEVLAFLRNKNLLDVTEKKLQKQKGSGEIFYDESKIYTLNHFGKPFYSKGNGLRIAVPGSIKLISINEPKHSNDNEKLIKFKMSYKYNSFNCIDVSGSGFVEYNKEYTYQVSLKMNKGKYIFSNLIIV